MRATLTLEGPLKFKGLNEKEQATIFDTIPSAGGDGSAPTPMEVMLQAMASCSGMDVVSIIRKKRRTITDFKMHVVGERKEEHPRIFTMAHIIYELDSPDAELEDLKRAVELSQSKYCGASAMFKMAGCLVSWDLKLTRNGVEIEEDNEKKVETL